jgi:DNA-directed RNA polymerase subunit P
MYRCARCKEPLRADAVTLQCEKCGSRMFYKERPNVKKVLKAR